MSWSNLGHDSQRTSADPDGNLTNIAEIWVRKGGSDNKNGWAGGVITDSDSVYYFYASYYPNIAGTGDRFSLNRYSKNGTLAWSNKQLGNHNDLGTWPARATTVSVNGTTEAIVYHDYRWGQVDKFLGTEVGGGWQGGDSYGNVVFNPSGTKMFGCRTFWNEGFLGYGWVKGIDLTVYNGPLGNAELWVRNADDGHVVDDPNFTGVGGNILYDNSKVFYCPHYGGVNPNFHTGIYCWDEAGVEQWNVSSYPASRASAGGGRLYMMESSTNLFNTPNSPLVARSQTDGSIVWSTGITGVTLVGQPPVVVNNLVIVASSTGVHARNSTTGATVWDAAIVNIDFPTDTNQGYIYTVLAAAITSNTLVVCAKAGIYILSLVDGSIVQFYDSPSILGRPLNPVIDGNRLYVVDGTDTYNPGAPQTVICLEEGATPPSGDTTPPSTPGNPTFSAVTSNGVTVSWTASTDNVGVSYYNLFYKAATSTTWKSRVIQFATTTTFQSTLINGLTYDFYVNAVDSSGNVSANSATTSVLIGSVIPVDTTPPTAPGTPTFSNVTTSGMTVSWSAATDANGISTYRLFWRPAGGTYSQINTSSTNYNLASLSAGTTYEVYVNALDTTGNSSTNSATASQATLSIPIVDTTPPSTPGNPTFSSVTTTSMLVSWTVSSDTSGISYYTLFYRQLGGVWASINRTTANYSLTGLLENTTYEFYVNATDNNGNISADSSITSQATLPIPPNTFTQISGTTSLSASTHQKTMHNLNWQNLPATMELQRKTGKTSFVTIYTGDAPYSYDQPDLKTVYYYRILVNSVTPSNTISLKSARK